MILNIDLSPRWGWPTHQNCTVEEEVLGCECCFDCGRLECTRCMVNSVNTRAWFAELCDDLPADYLIDWVRVYQHKDSSSIGCDPPSHPTREWIHHHADAYRTEDMEVPLLAVAPGGGECSMDAECGYSRCKSGMCECEGTTSANWTGPWCRSQAAGSSSACWTAEQNARRDAAAAAATQSSTLAPSLACAAPRYIHRRPAHNHLTAQAPNPL